MVVAGRSLPRYLSTRCVCTQSGKPILRLPLPPLLLVTGVFETRNSTHELKARPHNPRCFVPLWGSSFINREAYLDGEDQGIFEGEEDKKA